MFVLLCIILKNNRGNATVYREQYFTFIQRGIKVIGIVVRFLYLLCRCVSTLFILYFLWENVWNYGMHIIVWGYTKILVKMPLIIVLCALHASALIQKVGKYVFFVIHYHIVYFAWILLSKTKHSRGIGLACCHNNVYLEPCLYAIN